MSSGLLYLAIVGVWAGVLVPMWVRSSDAGEARGAEPADVPVPRGQGRARARVVARRRRRLSGILLFFVVTVGIAASELVPWWIVAVPGCVLLGFLACLRAAARYDLELAEWDRLRAEGFDVDDAEHTAEAAYAPAGEDIARVGQTAADGGVVAGEGSDPGIERDAYRDPRVIDFPPGGARGSRTSARGELFDQYDHEPRRAAGDH